jgi:outer membrane protein
MSSIKKEFTMYHLRLRTIIVTGTLALGCAVPGFSQTAASQTTSAAALPAGIQTPAPAVSQTGNIVALPSKVAVISIQPAIMATKEGTAAGKLLQQKYAPKQAEFERRKIEIDALTEQLKKGGETLDDAAKVKLNHDIDLKTKALQRDAQEASQDSQEDMGKVYNEIGDKMLQIIEPYAYQNGYAVVLDVSGQQTPVIWAAGSSNITADIVKLYDEAHPATTLAPPPKAPTQAPPKPATQTTGQTPVKKQ